MKGFFLQSRLHHAVLLLLASASFFAAPLFAADPVADIVSKEGKPRIRMDIQEKYRTHQQVLETFTKEKIKSEAYNLELDKLGWKNPAPAVADLKVSPEQLRSLTGDRIVLMMHAPRDVDVPYYGDMIRWHNARFVTAVTELPMSAEKVRQLIIDNDQSDGWKDVEPFVRETNVEYRHAQDQVGLHYKIQARISIIRINGNIYIRNRYEDTGDITSLFLTGDIGVALGVVPIIPKAVLSPLTVANVRRWEFIPIDAERSLLAITDWSEVMNDSHLSKRMSQYDEDSTNLGGISDEDLVGPYPGVAANLNNFKQTVLKIKAMQEDTQETASNLRDRATTPNFVGKLDGALIERLGENGPVVFLHPRQDIKADYGHFPLHFVTAAFPVKASFEDLRRYSAQMDHYADYIPQLEYSKLVKGSFDIPEFSQGKPLPEAEVALRMNLGKHTKVISSFDIHYGLRYFWESPQRLAFEANGGEIETIHGAVEWQAGSRDDKSLLFYTTATDLGPKPKFPLSLSQHIPGSDIISGVMVAVMAVGRQGPWVEWQLEQEKARSRP